MLSILIPTYNYNIFPLVTELFNQAKVLKVEFEIITIDDSSTRFQTENNKINHLENCSYIILSKNIGRSSIRNLLAKKAKFNWLLFLDADVYPNSENFILNYLNSIDSTVKIVNGGTKYQKEKPIKAKIFRWVYGNKRESKTKEERDKNVYLSLLTLNFLIHKSIFESVSFNETIPNLRHEDTLFSFDLMKNNVKIENIENSVTHNGLDDFEIAINKENNSLINLNYLTSNELIPAEYLKFTMYYKKIKKYKLHWFFLFFYTTLKRLMIMNLKSNKPSLFIFDLYRLGFYCEIKNRS